MNITKPITRFAPSPTGFLHIGGARTALYNYLFAKHHGGTFRLRIEDTDLKRSTDEAKQAILNGLDWLGLHADNEIVYQSKNAPAHVQAAHTLVERGAAYLCYATHEEVEVLREQSRMNGTAFRSPWRTKPQTPPDDTPYVVRFKVPDGQTSIHDHVQGDITWDNKQFDDLVLLRADGTPTYMLAVVVDDHNMGVTHVIRGDDHLINAGRQQLIYEALDWPVPQWTHVPLIHGPDGKKLSKRHGALGVEAYEDLGYLPEGLRNYLLKLGWSHGDKELFFDGEDVDLFSLDGLNSAPARLDFDKMDYINSQHLLRVDDERLMTLAMPFLEQLNTEPLSSETQKRVRAALDALKVRAKTLVSFAEQANFLLLNRPLELNAKARKAFKNDTLETLNALTLQLETIQDMQWNKDVIHECLNSFVEETGIGFGKFGQPARAALTAGHPAPDLSLVMALLGRKETLGRLKDVVDNLS